MRANLKTKLVAAASIGIVAFGVTACGDDSDTDDSTGTSSSASAPKPVASIDAVTGKSTAIALDAGFTDALTALKLTPGVTGDGQLTDEGSLVFPITGGNVTVFEPGQVSPYVIGQLQHVDSGLTLTAGDTVVKLSNFNVDPGVSRVYGDVYVNGELAAASAFLFQLDGRTLEPLAVEGSEAVLTGTKVEISDVAAGVLNDVFKTDAVKAGLLVGIATITVDVPA